MICLLVSEPKLLWLLGRSRETSWQVAVDENLLGPETWGHSTYRKRSTLAIPQSESIRKWHGVCVAMWLRTAGVHAGRGDCNRAVEVCVSGFGNPNRNRGGDNPGERFQRVQRLVGRFGGRVRRLQATDLWMSRGSIYSGRETAKGENPTANVPGLKMRFSR